MIASGSHTRLTTILIAVACVPLATGTSAASATMTVRFDERLAGRQPRIQPHIAVQNTWFTDVNVRRYGVLNGVISISGHWFLAPKTGDIADFLAKTQEDVERRLAAFKTAHPEVDPDTDATIVMDIEGQAHPNDLHTYSDSDQDAIVNAYRVRIAATKAVFPNAKVALYGTLNPDGRGRADNETYQARLRALKRAGRAGGLYDDLDYLVPVLYVRFGCDDEAKGPCDRHWRTLESYTRLGVDGSRQLRRSDGSSLPLLPLLGFRVNNGNSAFHRELLMNLGIPHPAQATLGKQIDILAGSGVEQFALWTGKDSNELGTAGDPTVTDYLCELFRRRPCRSRWRDTQTEPRSGHEGFAGRQP